ncbi:N-formylglutamate amidohydrolase [Pontibacter vulgaris]|uniref:N-formylglutamate amidohydrolase n=1 Tax=Pontibacter vulgaris TaxID=2905679 RepID=UPI001FA70D6E|nr:N-formylglutamate amidohydrolase [Pontibacter vulgaris]
MLKLLLTCEHGGNRIPEKYTSLFLGKEDLLNSHQGWDPGALDLYFELEDLADESIYAETSRLLVELNRSLHHPKLFSVATKPLPIQEKASIIQHYYQPYRQQVEEMVDRLLAAGNQVLHLSVHSFTPVLDGEERNADIGLLFDPVRKQEQLFCKQWKQQLKHLANELRVRFNYPYQGKADGLTTYLRKKYSPVKYSGIELEVNQKFPLGHDQDWKQLKQTIKTSLAALLKNK